MIEITVPADKYVGDSSVADIRSDLAQTPLASSGLQVKRIPGHKQIKK
jgi:hypothetical protein